MRPLNFFEEKLLWGTWEVWLPPAATPRNTEAMLSPGRWLLASVWMRWGCYCWDTSLMGESCFGSLLRPGQDCLIAGSGLSLFLLNLLSFLHSQGPDLQCSVKYLSTYYCPLLLILIPILVFLHLNQFY